MSHKDPVLQEGRWIPFRCPHCSGEFRLQRRLAVDGLLCPWCDAEIREIGSCVVDEQTAEQAPSARRRKAERRIVSRSKDEETVEDLAETTPLRPRSVPDPDQADADPAGGPGPDTADAPDDADSSSVRYEPRQIPLRPRPYRVADSGDESEDPEAIEPGGPPEIQDDRIRELIAGQQVPEIEPEEPEQVAVALRERKSAMPRLLSHDDFEAETAKLDTHATPDWEQTSRVRTKSDHGDYVRVLRPAADGSPTMEWVTLHRSELFSKTSRWIQTASIWLSIAAVVLVVVGFSLQVANRYFSTFDPNAGEGVSSASVPDKPAPADAPNVREMTLFAADAHAAEAEIRRFCAATTAEDRLKLVRLAERVEPMLRDWEAERGGGPIEIGARVREKKVLADGRPFVILAFRIREAPGFQFFAAEQLPDGSFLTDWEVSVDYQPLALEEFKTIRPSAPIEFRVKLKRSDYFDEHFPEDEYLCFELSYPGRDFLLHGYARKSTNFARELELTAALGSPSMILQLRYPENSVSDVRVEIVGIARRSWFY